MVTQRITFPGSGGHLLSARLDAPEGAGHPCALFAHCFTCSMDIFAASRIAQRLVECGVAVLRFDFTGLGHSEGEFANTDFSSNVADLVAAAAWLRANSQAPTLLVGHSLGGAAVLSAAHLVPEVRAIATIGAPSDPAHVVHLFRDQVPHIEEHGDAVVQLAGRPFRIRREFLVDVSEHNLATRVSELRKPLLILHAPQDATVGIGNATSIFVNARHPKSFVALHEADHLLTRHEDAVYVADLIAVWSQRYMG